MNPIFITQSPNDQDLVPLLGDLCRPYPIPYGDFNFEGVWVGGERVWVWGERKKLGDLVQCVMSTGRLLAQVQRAREAGFRFFFLIVESIFRRAPDNGALQYRTGSGWRDYHLNPRSHESPTIPYKRVADYLNELDWYCGVRVRVSSGPADTARKIVDVWRLFQQRPEEHGSLKQFEEHQDPYGAYLSRPSLVRRIAKELPGVSWSRSLGFEAEFESAQELCRVLGEGDGKRLRMAKGVGKETVRTILEGIQ